MYILIKNSLLRFTLTIQDCLSQLEHFENTNLEEIELPSTQPPDDMSDENFDVHVIKRSTPKRLMNGGHPVKTIISIKPRKKGGHGVHVEWWEPDENDKHCKSNEPLAMWMKGEREQCLLADCLASNFDAKESEKMVGSCHWKILKDKFF